MVLLVVEAQDAAVITKALALSRVCFLRQTGTGVTSISPIPPVVPHDEIDVLAMLQSLWRQKVLILASALLFAVLALVYAYSITPEYEVSTILRPVALNDLDALNRSKVYSLPPSKALVRVGAALDSYETRLGYFRSNMELQAAYSKSGRSAEQAFEAFNRDALKLVQPDPKKTDLLSAFIGLEMRYSQGINGKDALNGLVKYAIESERQKISADLKVMIDNRVKEVDDKLVALRVKYNAGKEGQIASLLEADNLKRAQLNDELKALRVQLKLRREDRVAQLNEAISIARSLGLKKPTTPSAMGRSEVEVTGNVITEVNNQQFPLYFMGTDALEAEQQVLRKRASDDFVDPRIAQIRKELLLLSNNRQIQMLKQRENEDLFVKGIEALRAQRTELLNIPTDMSGLSLVSIDRLAVEPVSPVKPRKSLFAALGAILGGVIGCIIVLLRLAFKKRRREQARISLSSVPKKLETEFTSPPVVVR
ncbi:Wzz/FepE/Etk N-terminal domain-containing protein [Pseudomonas sp. NUPR-001]|uniref:Wzz/FepE/Etk N-terminal domain-containing protein n=1 Tax=Pseudomonas sp. NUPR-001 TaxID=3416058 RepID=UPI003F978EBC